MHEMNEIFRIKCKQFVNNALNIVKKLKKLVFVYKTCYNDKQMKIVRRKAPSGKIVVYVCLNRGTCHDGLFRCIYLSTVEYSKKTVHFKTQYVRCICSSA